MPGKIGDQGASPTGVIGVLNEDGNGQAVARPGTVICPKGQCGFEIRAALDGVVVAAGGRPLEVEVVVGVAVGLQCLGGASKAEEEADQKE